MSRVLWSGHIYLVKQWKSHFWLCRKTLMFSFSFIQFARGCLTYNTWPRVSLLSEGELIRFFPPTEVVHRTHTHTHPHPHRHTHTQTHTHTDTYTPIPHPHMLLCLWSVRPNGSVQLVCDNQTCFTRRWLINRLQVNDNLWEFGNAAIILYKKHLCLIRTWFVWE